MALPTTSAGRSRAMSKPARPVPPPPPGDADVLFDGHDLSKWTGDHFEEWTVHDGVVTTGARVYNFLKTKESYGDAQIHVEFREPAQPNPPLNPQYHGNSGVFPMGLYEVQILDSTNNQTYADGMVGAIYTQIPAAGECRAPRRRVAML